MSLARLRPKKVMNFGMRANIPEAFREYCSDPLTISSSVSRKAVQLARRYWKALVLTVHQVGPAVVCLSLAKTFKRELAFWEKRITSPAKFRASRMAVTCRTICCRLRFRKYARRRTEITLGAYSWIFTATPEMCPWKFAAPSCAWPRAVFRWLSQVKKTILNGKNNCVGFSVYLLNKAHIVLPTPRNVCSSTFGTLGNVFSTTWCTVPVVLCWTNL